MNRLFENCEPFSLTLTHSRWEGGQPLDAFKKLLSRSSEYSRRSANPLGAFLPLPAGEGWGEGELFSIHRAKFS
jgi:hypothetical protein